MFDIINSPGNKLAAGFEEPSFGKPTYLKNNDNQQLVEQYVSSLDKKLAKAEQEAKAAKELAKKRDAEFAREKEAWTKEKEELTRKAEGLAEQLNGLQMRQAQKATDEFNAYWAARKKEAEDDSSSAAAALLAAEEHIKRLQETNANLSYRVSEMRQDLMKLEAAAEAAAPQT